MAFSLNEFFKDDTIKEDGLNDLNATKARCHMNIQEIEPYSYDKQLSDIEWALDDLEILSKYAGQIVVVHRRRILGSGADHMEALRSARTRPDCPGQFELVFVPIPESPWFDAELFAPTKRNRVRPSS